jgi:hypothetical protein
MTAAAQDALARLDDGIPLPGDQALADAYDRYCQQSWLVLDDQRREVEYTAWLAGQCPVCEEGGTGPVCDDHHRAAAALNRWHNR